MQAMHHPMHGEFKMPAWPVRVDGAPPKVKPSPLLGQHTAEVLRSWLGIERRRRSRRCTAKASSECVIASAAKQSRADCCLPGLLRCFAPRNDKIN